MNQDLEVGTQSRSVKEHPYFFIIPPKRKYFIIYKNKQENIPGSECTIRLILSNIHQHQGMED